MVLLRVFDILRKTAVDCCCVAAVPWLRLDFVTVCLVLARQQRELLQVAANVERLSRLPASFSMCLLLQSEIVHLLEVVLAG